MIEKDLEKAFSEFGEELSYTGKIPDEWILKAEALLKFKFPVSYRYFLSNWGEVSFAGKEYYGIFKEDFENSGIPDVVWYNLKKQKDNFPKDIIVFRQDDGVVYYCLGVSRLNKKRECPIVVWDNIAKEISEVLEMNFGEFLLDDLAESFEE